MPMAVFFDGDPDKTVWNIYEDEDGICNDLPWHNPLNKDPHKVFCGWFLDQDATQPLDTNAYSNNREPLEEDVLHIMPVTRKHTISLLAGGHGYFTRYNSDDEGEEEHLDHIVLSVSKTGSIDLDSLYEYGYEGPTSDDNHFTPNGYITESGSPVKNRWNFRTSQDVTLTVDWIQSFVVTFDANGSFSKNWDYPETTYYVREGSLWRIHRNRLFTPRKGWDLPDGIRMQTGQKAKRSL